MTTPQQLSFTESYSNSHSSEDGLWEPVLKVRSEKVPWYKTELGQLYNLDVVEFLQGINSGVADVVFADPPYNISKAEWDKFESMNTYLDWIDEWLSESHRILKDNGTMFVMGFSEILAHVTVRASQHFSNYRWLIWHYRNKPSLGKFDWVRSHEAILHLRKGDSFTFNIDLIREPYNSHTKKYPERAQGETSQYGQSKNGEKQVWEPTIGGAKPRDVIEVPAMSNGMAERTSHPTQKPEELLRKLLLGVTNAGETVLRPFEERRERELIIDPFGGSGTTYAVCEQFGLNWLGTDKSDEYCSLIAERIEAMPHQPMSYWLELDQKRQRHRNNVRYGKSKL